MLTKENVLKIPFIKDHNGFNFEELSNIYKINLRGEANDENFISNTKKILNIIIPIEPNTINNNNKIKIIWLSPNEWLIEIYEVKYFNKILLDLKYFLNSENTAVTDVTENRTVLKLSGINLYKLLSKFMIIDLDKILNKKSSVAQTIFIKFPILIIRDHKKNEKQSIFIYTNRSHAQYIINLLLDGSQNIDF